MARERNRRSRAWLIGLAILIALLLIGYDAWRLFDGSGGSDDPEPPSPAGLNLPPGGDEGVPPPEAVAAEAEQAPTNSMVRALLAGSEANRNQIFRQTITGIGMMCSEVSSSGEIGSTGAIWRVRCADSATYSVEVDELGRMIVTPMPYGDFAPSSEPVRSFIVPAPILPETLER